MRESIFFASIRSFFVVLFGVAGLLAGFLVIGGLIGGFSSAIDGAPVLNYTYTPEIKPNAEGVRKKVATSDPIVLKLNINGIIGLDSLTRREIAQQLIESRERTFDNDRVKAILLYIDSPGGTVVDADGIYREIKTYKEQYKVPVYAYIDGLCASGGYYIAAAADKVFASPASLIGSVGVITPPIMNVSQLLEKIGVQSLTLYDGKGKDNLNPFRPWHKGEEDNIKASISYYYDMFVNVVTAARPGLDKTKLVDDYGANIYPASVAKEHGYIDDADATERQVLKSLLETAGIHDETYQVVELENKNWLSELFHSEAGLLSGKMKVELDFAPELSSQLSGQYLYLYKP
jgi:protease IV